jgi:ATP-binding cassette subfamily F protein uup
MIAGRLTPTVGTIDIGRTVQVGYYDQLGRELNLSQRVREAVAGDKGAPSVEDLNLMKRFWFDGDAQFAPIGTLSGGERRRLQLLLTLIEQPNVLLLDEPTNDLDLDTLRALEDYLDDWPGIVVVVSHDRAFIDRTVEEIFALDGDGGASLMVGGVDAWLRQRTARPTSQRAMPAQRTGAQKAAAAQHSKSTRKRKGGGRVSVAHTPPPPKLPKPKPTPTQNKPTPAVANTNPAMSNANAKPTPNANLHTPIANAPTPSANVGNVTTQTGNVNAHLSAPYVQPVAKHAQQNAQQNALQRQKSGFYAVKRV